ncbi:DNA cytosine methyltransferase [Bacillus sp. 3255]|uniref:DNA cytosine methyltransferase n=1 Tax=Bacillus sp. 3255 TaxID=2817904 RepID=UPI00285EBEAC|nr:DNA cytosine methyltransferase [Bacillus sp. 3255]MDR6884316.1 DNA (cytosine-5)-methyltransferase 1 [Bacillus sp. 3255]
MKCPDIFSFFSGAGFLDLGFEMSGYNVVMINEFNDSFRATYEYSRKKMGLNLPEFGCPHKDVTEFLTRNGTDELRRLISICRDRGNPVGFIGGPPCPDFSVGGKNRGFEGDNGKLTATYVDIICEQGPDFFLLENVKGLWRTKKHRVFYDHMKKKLQDAGYVTTERLINAIEYGVPQQRERIILFGIKGSYLNDLGITMSENATLGDIFPWEAKVRYPLAEIMEFPFPVEDPFGEDLAREIPEGVPPELTAEHWFRLNDVYNHPNSHMSFTPKAGLAKFLVIPEGDDSKKSYKRLHRWRYSPTAAYGNNEVHLHPYKARRLSVAEALAIQSLPKQFELPPEITLSNAFKTVGNGVPYLAAKGIAETVLEFINVRVGV